MNVGYTKSMRSFQLIVKRLHVTPVIFRNPVLVQSNRRYLIAHEACNPERSRNFQDGPPGSSCYRDGPGGPSSRLSIEPFNVLRERNFEESRPD